MYIGSSFIIARQKAGKISGRVVKVEAGFASDDS
jgi:hypothetical protein